MESIFGRITVEDLLIILIINSLLILVLLFMNLANRSRLKWLRAKYNRFMSGVSQGNMEQLIEECLNQVDEVKQKNKDIENQINHIERNLLQAIQKIGIIRYNAFDNMGGDFSFSIALLDSNDNGFVLTAIHSRENSSAYAKPIIGGRSRYTLSAEEIQAIEQARKNHRERFYKD